MPHATTEVGSFWWRDVCRLNTLYRGVACCKLGDGSTVLFRGDLWSNNVFQEQFPRLFSFDKSEQASIKVIMAAQDLELIFHLPLTQEAHHDLQELQFHLNGIPYHENEKDQWTFIWGNRQYTSSRIYRFAFSGLHVSPVFSWLWKSKSMPRITTFGWLLLVDRLNTKDMLQRRRSNVQSGTSFVMCSDNQ